MALQEMLQNLGGFQSLAANAQRMQQQEQQQTATKEASDLLRTFYKSQQEGKPDYNALNEAILRSPELSQNVLNGIGLQDKRAQQQAATDVVNLYQSLNDPQAFGRTMAARINGILQRGGDPSDSIALTKIYNEQGPDAARRAIQQVGAAMANQGLIKPEFIGLGGGAEPMSAYQKASVDLRKQELEFQKEQKRNELKEKALQAQLAKEKDELERQKIQAQIDETKQKMAALEKQKQTTEREKDADLKQAYFGIDNMLNTVARIKKNPKLDSVIGTVQGRMDAYIDDEAAATIRLIENLGSQAFMAMIPGLKGMGALSNAEGDKLAASLQNISRVTSEPAFRETLSEIERLMGKSRQFLAERYGKQESAPDVPAAQNNTVNWNDLP